MPPPPPGLGLRSKTRVRSCSTELCRDDPGVADDPDDDVYQPPRISTPIMMAITLGEMAKERVAGAMARAG